MGGDRVVSHDLEDDLSYEKDSSVMSTSQTSLCLRDAMSMKIENIQHQILRSYDDLRKRSKDLEGEKQKILSYKPGAWIENVGCLELHDYDVPPTTSLLLIGPRGSGKSSLVNRISKAFEDDKLLSSRAQVSYNPYVGEGTIFLREYMIPRESTSFCLYDTRSLSDDISENYTVLQQWINHGVRHGQLVTWHTEDPVVKESLRMKDVNSGCLSSEIRQVNFVILVVDGFSVLNCTESASLKDYENVIASTFHLPHLSYQDDKPVVVFTHGDLLSLSERARVRAHLGELLGIPPTEQIFDIPDSDDPETQLAIVDMLRYSLERAERNFPQKIRIANEVSPTTTKRCKGTWSSFLGSDYEFMQPAFALLALIMLSCLVISFGLSKVKDCVNHLHVCDDAQGHGNITKTSKNQVVIPRMKPNTGQHADSCAQPEVIPQMKLNMGEHAASSAEHVLIPEMKPNTGEHLASSAKSEVSPEVEHNTGQCATSSSEPEVTPQMKPNNGEHLASSATPEVAPQVEHTGQRVTSYSKPEVSPEVELITGQGATSYSKSEVILQMKLNTGQHADSCAQPEVIPQMKPNMGEHAASSAEHVPIPEMKPNTGEQIASSAKSEVSPEVEHNTGQRAISSSEPEVTPQMKPNTGEHLASSAKPEVSPEVEHITGQSATSSSEPEVTPQMKLNAGEHLESSAKPEVSLEVEHNTGLRATSSSEPEVTPQMKPNTGEHLASSAKPEVSPDVEHNTGQGATSSSEPEVTPQMKPNAGEQIASSAKPEVSQGATSSSEPEVTPQMKPNAGEQIASSAKPEVSPEVEHNTGQGATSSSEPEVTPQMKPNAGEQIASSAQPEVSPEVEHNTGQSATSSSEPEGTPQTKLNEVLKIIACCPDSHYIVLVVVFLSFCQWLRS